MVGILLSYWDGLFSSAMLVSGRVNHLRILLTLPVLPATMFFFKPKAPAVQRKSRWLEENDLPHRDATFLTKLDETCAVINGIMIPINGRK